MFNNVGIVARFGKRKGLELAKKLAKYLKEKELEKCIEEPLTKEKTVQTKLFHSRSSKSTS